MLGQKHKHVYFCCKHILTLESAPSGHLRNCSLIYFHFHISKCRYSWTVWFITRVLWHADCFGVREVMRAPHRMDPAGDQLITMNFMVSWGWIIIILILWHFLQCIIRSKPSCTTLMLNLISCSTLRNLMSRHRLNKLRWRVSMLISHSNHVRMYESSSLREPADVCTAHTQLIPTLQRPRIFHQCDNFVFCCVMSCTHGRNLCCLITPNSSCIIPV